MSEPFEPYRPPQPAEAMPAERAPLESDGEHAQQCRMFVRLLGVLFIVWGIVELTQDALYLYWQWVYTKEIAPAGPEVDHYLLSTTAPLAGDVVRLMLGVYLAFDGGWVLRTIFRVRTNRVDTSY